MLTLYFSTWEWYTQSCDGPTDLGACPLFWRPKCLRVCQPEYLMLGLQLYRFNRVSVWVLFKICLELYFWSIRSGFRICFKDQLVNARHFNAREDIWRMNNTFHLEEVHGLYRMQDPGCIEGELKLRRHTGNQLHVLEEILVNSWHSVQEWVGHLKKTNSRNILNTCLFQASCQIWLP